MYPPSAEPESTTARPARSKRGRSMLVVGAAMVGAAIGGAAIAGAATGGSSSNTASATNAAGGYASATAPDPAAMTHGPNETLLTGTTAEKVRAAALAAVPNATVIRVETDSGGATYEAHLTKSDGTRVTVKLDASFKVTGIEAGFGSGPGGSGGPPPGYGGQAPGVSG